MKKRNVVIISGGFDPIHPGHLEYIRRARELAGKRGLLIAIVNNDEFLINKKGFKFQDEEARRQIVENIRGVDGALISRSTDQTVNADLMFIKRFTGTQDCLIFAKGGDRTRDEIPEAETCQALGIEIVDGLGKKIDSSSHIAQNFLDAMEIPAELRRQKYGPLDPVDQEALSNREEPEG